MEFILLLGLLAMSASFSGAETAFFSLGPAELAKLGQERGRAGERVVALLSRAHQVLSALLIGNLVVNIAASVVATSLCLNWFGARGVAVAVPVTTLGLLLVGEITPKMLALRFRVPLARWAATPLGGWVFLVGPLIKASGAVTTGMIRRLPLEPTGSVPLSLVELQTACDLAVGDGMLSETEGRTLARLLQLSDLAVADIMTPRNSVVTLEREYSLKQVLATARRAGFNRYVVVDGAGGRPVGLFHLKDLLRRAPAPEYPLHEGLRELLFVPESKDVAALLDEMGEGRAHLAVVIDEHGDYTGIVTMADCLQALLGSAADVAGRDSEAVPLGDGRWVLSGRTDLRALEETCGLRLPTSRDYVTVAGYMMTALGRVLEPGDRITLPEARLTVLEVDGHRVEQVKVTLLEGLRAANRGKSS